MSCCHDTLVVDTSVTLPVRSLLSVSRKRSVDFPQRSAKWQSQFVSSGHWWLWPFTPWSGYSPGKTPPSDRDLFSLGTTWGALLSLAFATLCRRRRRQMVPGGNTAGNDWGHLGDQTGRRHVRVREAGRDLWWIAALIPPRCHKRVAEAINW